MATCLYGTFETRLARVEERLEWESSLPPQTPEEREMAIYEAIYVDMQRAWKVAQTFKLSPATVESIARQTRDKLARREHEFYKLRKSDALGERHAQYVHLARELKEAWTESKQGRNTLYIDGPGGAKRETIRGMGLGDPRYMNLLLRVRKELDAIEDRMGMEPVGSVCRTEPGRGKRSRRKEGDTFDDAALEQALTELANALDPTGASARLDGPTSPRSRPAGGTYQSRRAKHLAGRAGDMEVVVPHGVSTGAQGESGQGLATTQVLPFPPVPCGCQSDGGP